MRVLTRSSMKQKDSDSKSDKKVILLIRRVHGT